MTLALLVVLVAGLQDNDGKDAYVAAMEKLEQGRYENARKDFQKVGLKFMLTKWGQAALKKAEDNVFLRAVDQERNGPTSNRVDVALMADGVAYLDDSQKAWDKAAGEIVRTLFESRTLRAYRRAFNFHRLHLASKRENLKKGESGCADTALQANDDEVELGVSRDYAGQFLKESQVPDGLAIVVVRPAAGTRHGDSTRGIAIVGDRPDAPTLVHAFAHAFAGLDDEFGAKVDDFKRAYPPRRAVLAPNVDAGDAPSKCPWAHWLDAKKRGDGRAGRIGRYEGAARIDRSVFRPSHLCVMNDASEFCAVCREALVLTIYTYLRPIDVSTENDRILKVAKGESLTIELVPFQPDGHNLKVTWILQKQDGSLIGPKDAAAVGSADGMHQAIGNYTGLIGPRKGLGADWTPPVGEELKGGVRADGASKVHSVTLASGAVEAGSYRLTAVVQDPCDWVLRDSENLLRDWRAWDAVVE